MFPVKRLCLVDLLSPSAAICKALISRELLFQVSKWDADFQCDSSLSQSSMYRNQYKDYLYFVDMGGPDTHKEINKCLRWVPQWFFNGCQFGKLDWALPVRGSMILVWCWGICGFHLLVISQNGELRKITYWLNHRIPHLEGTSWDDRARLLKVNA